MPVKEISCEIKKVLEFLNDIGIDVIEKEVNESFLPGLSLGPNCIYVDYDKLLYPGDIFLEDLRQYRENQLAKMGFEGVFPLWKIPTQDLIQEFISLGFKTIVVCVNERYLDKSFVGRIIDHKFIDDLPDNVDVCGENGEFHTFTFDGPIFSAPIQFEIGEIVYRKYEKPKNENSSDTACDTSASDAFDYGFWYCDLI